jgi:hypothetical protein
MRGPVNLPEGFDPKDRKYKKFANQLPTRDVCDLNDPAEMYLWGFVALPGQNGGMLGFPASVLMLWSEHFCDLFGPVKCENCGHEHTPGKTYVPPAANDPHWMTSPGRWMHPDKAPVRDVDPMDDALDKLTPTQQAALFQRLKNRHEKGTI